MQISNYSGYEFFEDGKVFSYKVNKYLKPRLGRDGYLNLSCVDDNGNKVTHNLNNWICRAFLGEPLDNSYDAMHIDENKLNCHINNLIWAKHKENINYGHRTQRNAQSHYKKIAQYTIDNTLICIYNSVKEASINTHTSYTGIIKCAKNKIKTSNNFIWKYI